MTMVRRLLLTALVAVAIVGGLPGLASAHALLKSSVPAAASNVPEAPHQILLTFTEPPDPTLSLVTLVTSSGAIVKTGKAQPVLGAPTKLRLAVPTIPNGVYTVNWRTVSKTDGHVTGGSFAFGLRTQPPSGSSTTTISTSPTPSALALASRWLLFAGLAGLVGGAAVQLFVRAPVSARAARWLLIVGWTAATLGLVGAYLAESRATGASLGALARTSAGRPFLLEAGVLVVLGLLVVLLFRRPDRRWWWGLGIVGPVALFVHAMSGHADNPSRWRWFNLGVEWVHLMAVAIWIGGLVWLFVGIRSRTASGGSDEERRAGIVRFSTMAAVALGLVAASGLGRALNELNGLHSLWSTSFGKTLLVKIGLFGLLLAFGAVNHYLIVPRIRSGDAGATTLARSVRVELGVAAVTIAAGVLLSQLPPASYGVPAAASAARPLVVTGSDFGTTVRLRMQISPGSVGSNRFDAQVVDYDTGAPVDARSLVLDFSLPADPDVGGSSLSLRRTGSHWVGTGSNLSVTGTWAVDATVQEHAGGVSVPLKVTPKLPPEQISTIQGNPTLYTIALGGGFSVQTYVEPDKPGVANVHFTFFTSSGKEEPIASATAMRSSPSGATSGMKLIRFDPGHFAANTTLTAGTWTFAIQAKTTSGVPLFAYFHQTIG
jgi:copper transport protein